MKIATQKLLGSALHWAYHQADPHAAVEIKEGKLYLSGTTTLYEPSTNWLQGGPILNRYAFTIRTRSAEEEASLAHPDPNFHVKVELFDDDSYASGFGRDILTAALRCIVALRIGPLLDIPSEFLNRASPLYREGPSP
jgi:hypothetical protein